MSEYKSEVSTSESIEDNISSFANFIIKRRLPLVIDGLTPIHRRILWMAKTGTSKMKVVKLGGQVGAIHPHGDQSINDAIITMCQPFSNIIPLIFSDSGVGTYSGEPPSAARYVDVHSAEFARDVFFNNINLRTLVYVRCETDEGEEPLYFVPVIPYALMAGTFGIGIGYKTDISALDIHSLCQLTRKYVELRTSTSNWQSKLHTLVPYLVPDFPSYCTIRNRDELVSAYRKGEFDCKIVTDGTLKITPTTISIQSVAPGEDLMKIFLKLGNAQKEKDGFITKHFSSVDDHAGKTHGESIGNLVFTLRRGENPFDVLAELKKACGFSEAWKPCPLFMDKHDKMIKANPFDLLNIWYTERYSAILGELKIKQVNLVLEYRQLMAKIIVAGHSDKVYQIINSSKSDDEAILRLCKAFKDQALTVYQAQFLVSLQLGQLTREGKDKLVERSKKVSADIKELQQRFLKIPEQIIEEVKAIDAKYSPRFPRKCIIPSYKGYVRYKGTGYTQVEEMGEFDELIKAFGVDNVDIHLYTALNRTYVTNEYGIQEDMPVEHPKQFKATGVYRLNHKAKNTVVFRNNGIYALEGLAVRGSDDAEIIPVVNDFLVVHKKGTVERIPVTADIVRKGANVSRMAIQDVCFVDPLEVDDYVVIHCNTAEMNTIKIDRVRKAGKLTKIVVGTWKVIGIYDANRPIMFSVPDLVRSRCPVRHVYLPDVTKFVKPGNCLRLQLTRKLIGDQELVPYARRSEIWTPSK